MSDSGESIVGLVHRAAAGAEAGSHNADDVAARLPFPVLSMTVAAAAAAPESEDWGNSAPYKTWFHSSSVRLASASILNILPSSAGF
jgi:hypothetical protein